MRKPTENEIHTIKSIMLANHYDEADLAINNIFAAASEDGDISVKDFPRGYTAFWLATDAQEGLLSPGVLSISGSYSERYESDTAPYTGAYVRFYSYAEVTSEGHGFTGSGEVPYTSLRV